MPKRKQKQNKQDQEVNRRVVAEWAYLYIWSLMLSLDLLSLKNIYIHKSLIQPASIIVHGSCGGAEI